MTDVRLTATNPEDSSVVPVACNSRGELLVTEPVIEQIDNDVTINGMLTSQSSYTAMETDSNIFANQGNNFAFQIRKTSNGSPHMRVNWDGSLNINRRLDEDFGNCSMGGEQNAFEGRNSSNALTWFVQYDGTTSAQRLLLNTEADNPDYWIASERAGEEEASYIGPSIDVGEELVFLRAQVKALMEKLKMTPEDGWPVWDGSDDA